MKKLILLLLISTNCFAADWHCISRTMLSCHTWRMSIPQGWIVSSDNTGGGDQHGYAMVFVPDATHTWSE